MFNRKSFLSTGVSLIGTNRLARLTRDPLRNLAFRHDGRFNFADGLAASALTFDGKSVRCWPTAFDSCVPLQEFATGDNLTHFQGGAGQAGHRLPLRKKTVTHCGASKTDQSPLRWRRGKNGRPSRGPKKLGRGNPAMVGNLPCMQFTPT